jgi:hypothetical protein
MKIEDLEKVTKLTERLNLVNVLLNKGKRMTEIRNYENIIQVQKYEVQRLIEDTGYLAYVLEATLKGLEIEKLQLETSLKKY